MDRLAGPEAHDAAAHRHLLLALAHEVHLDAAEGGVVERLVTERAQVEIGAELAIDAREEVQVELRGDALRVVVGGVQPRRILLEIDPDQEPAARARPPRARSAGNPSPPAA